MARVLSALALAVLAGLVALMGTVAHRSLTAAGIVVALIAVGAGAVFAKAWAGWTGFTAFAMTWVMAVVALALYTPNGSILIAADAYGRWWVFGGATVLSVIAALPRFVLVGRDVKS